MLNFGTWITFRERKWLQIWDIWKRTSKHLMWNEGSMTCLQYIHHLVLELNYVIRFNIDVIKSFCPSCIRLSIFLFFCLLSNDNFHFIIVISKTEKVSEKRKVIFGYMLCLLTKSWKSFIGFDLFIVDFIHILLL